ncbi:MAG: DUF523 domain-containing protein [Oribacterium sp.]|nr:DUF523 domain-containing protein [Oribacterium sp.]MDY6309072.1 DUF523 domain-containing protein [Oribacterium sp.]MDY6317146.1 DUF523 domain-containing protein [Oribacterium sp.]
MKKYIVSACLCGIPCRMDGKAKPNSFVVDLYKKGLVVPVCPEQDGGLSTPRDPSERLGDRVVSCKGKDVTEEFRRGAEIDLEKARTNGCTVAILKAKSPSCGVGMIHNGKFDGDLVPGDGVFTELLKKEGITCIVDTEAAVKLA